MTLMQEKAKCSILSIVPYRIIPTVNGGQVSILNMHHHMGKLISDHVVTTEDTGSSDAYAFDMHRALPCNATRYVPFAFQKIMVSLAKQYDVTAIMCDHPYMAISAVRLAKKLGLPYYLRCHNIESERFRTLGKPWWRIMRAYEKWAMQKASGVFFVAKEDAQWAVDHFGISAERCHFLAYGTTLSERPKEVLHSIAKKKLAAEWGISENKTWIYFIGSLDYKPNEEAVEYLLNEVAPRLRKSNSNYHILIGGKGLNQNLQEQVKASSDISYVGFIPDLDDFLNACDIMVNPVLTGGGVKTKAVEALAYNKIVVSPATGAAGLIPEVSGNNLVITPDNDWDAFTAATVNAMQLKADIPEDFYKIFYWGNVARQAVDIMCKG